MNVHTKKWIIAAVILVVVGALVFLAAFAAMDFDFSKISIREYRTNSYDVREDFNRIKIDASEAKVLFNLSYDGVCRVECQESKDESYQVRVENGLLVIESQDNRRWYDSVVDFNARSGVVNVYLPKSSYDILEIETSVGDVEVPESLNFRKIDISCDVGSVYCKAIASDLLEINTDIGDVNLEGIKTEGNIQVESSTGDITLKDVKATSLNVEAEIGDVRLENVVTSGRFLVTTETGSVILNGCDGSSIYIETDIGDVSGTLLSEKIIFAKSQIGDINVPMSTTGGPCEIHTSTGDIEIKFER